MSKKVCKEVIRTDHIQSRLVCKWCHGVIQERYETGMIALGCLPKNILPVINMTYCRCGCRGYGSCEWGTNCQCR